MDSLKPYQDEFGIKVDKKYQEFIDDFVMYETEAEPSIIKNIMPKDVDIIGFTQEKLAAATSSYMQTGTTVKKLFSTAKLQTINYMNREAAIGFLNGETTQQIIKRISDRSIYSERETKAIIRTSLNHVANQARRLVGEENSDIIKYVEWVSTLDFRTSDICRYRDGKRYKLNDKTPMPPAHINCRSTIVYITKFDNLENEYGRASTDGLTDSSTTYYEYLKRQSKENIHAILGVERGDLFISGKLTGEQLHARDGKMLTLEELRKKFLNKAEK